MKRIVISLAVVAIATALFAAPVENVISFQGKLVEGGVPVDGTRDIHFYLYDVETGGTSIWDENHLSVAVVAGLFNVELGGSALFDVWGVDFTDQYWLTFSVGGGAEADPRYKLTGTPYAMADGDWVVDGANIYTVPTGNVGIGTTAPIGKLHVIGDGEYVAPNFIVEGSAERQIAISGEGIWRRDFDTDNAGIAINRVGYNDGVTRFRDFNVYNGKNDEIILKVDGSAGAVGIGATTPTQRLHVNGSARVTGAYYDSGNNPGTAGQVLSSTATGTDWIDAGDNDWGYNSGSGLTGELYRTGNVGIGTTDPSARLQVDETGTQQALYVHSTTFDGSTVSEFVDINTSGNLGSADDLLNLNMGSGSDDDAQFIECNRGSTNKFRIDSDGSGYFANNVGIGDTPASSYALTVSSDESYQMRVGKHITDEWVYIGFDQIRTYDTPLYLNHSCPQDVIMCYGGGNVGIQTDSPSAPLEVHPDGNETIKVYTGLYNVYGRLTRYTSAHPHFGISYNSWRETGGTWHTDNGAYGACSIYMEDGNILFNTTWGTEDPHERMVIKDGGNVGILETLPCEALDVGGDVRADDFIEYSTDFVGDAISVLKKVEVREGEGDWKPVEHESWPKEIIREYIEEGCCGDGDIPENAQCTDLGGNNRKVYGRSLCGLTAINTRAIRQLIERVDNLETENARLRTEIEALKANR